MGPTKVLKLTVGIGVGRCSRVSFGVGGFHEEGGSGDARKLGQVFSNILRPGGKPLKSPSFSQFGLVPLTTGTTPICQPLNRPVLVGSQPNGLGRRLGWPKKDDLKHKPRAPVGDTHTHTLPIEWMGQNKYQNTFDIPIKSSFPKSD